MAHAEQINFCKYVKEKLPEYFTNKSILDIGSLDVNGNNRYLFNNCEYFGIDIGNGNNVDFVSLGHEFKSDKKYDVVISTECFEHDPYYDKTIKNAINNLLINGGLFLFTCATTGREVHGTISNHPYCSPLSITKNQFQNYYKNLTEDDIRNVIDINNEFISYEFDVNLNICDLYFWGIKK